MKNYCGLIALISTIAISSTIVDAQSFRPDNKVIWMKSTQAYPLLKGGLLKASFTIRPTEAQRYKAKLWKMSKNNYLFSDTNFFQEEGWNKSHVHILKVARVKRSAVYYKIKYKKSTKQYVTAWIWRGYVKVDSKPVKADVVIP